MSSQDRLAHLLDWIEARLDLDRCAEVDRRHCRALNFEPVDRLPVILAYPQDLFPAYPYPEAFGDPLKMLVNELAVSTTAAPCVVSSLAVGDDFPLQVRPNYGIGVIASLFGARIEVPEQGMPWVKPPALSPAEIVAAGVPDLSGGLGGRVIKTLHIFRDALAPYPKASRAIRLTQPDLQGVVDIAHLLWGSDFFLAFYEQPKLVHELLDLVAETYLAYLQRLKPHVNERAGEGCICLHWAICRGELLLKDDSTIMLSPAMYAEFVRPRNERILKRAGGGGIHFCGCGDHLREELLQTEGLQCLDMGQPEQNDMAEWEAALAERRIGLMRRRCELEEFGSLPATGVSAMAAAADLTAAEGVWRSYVSGR